MRAQEAELHCWAWLKERATEQALRLHPWERDILARVPLDAGTRIAAEVLEGPCTARRLVSSLTKGHALATLLGKVGDKYPALAEHDPFWRLGDAQLKQLAGDGGLSLLEGALLDCLPAASGPLWSLGEAVAKIEAVKFTSLCSLLGALGERRVDAVHLRLQGMLQGAEHVPEDWADSPLLAKAERACYRV